jgi:hypothetical protein
MMKTDTSQSLSSWSSGVGKFPYYNSVKRERQRVLQNSCLTKLHVIHILINILMGKKLLHRMLCRRYELQRINQIDREGNK